MRKCTVCKIEKLATNEFFHKSKDRPLGLDYRCKECSKFRKDNRTSAYRAENMTEKQKINRKKSQSLYNKSPRGRAHSTLAAYQQVDNKKDYDNDLTVKYIEYVRTQPCTYCGYKSTGLDRLNNNLGHTFKNCVPCCKECNVARNNLFTVEEMMILGETIKKIKDDRRIL